MAARARNSVSGWFSHGCFPCDVRQEIRGDPCSWAKPASAPPAGCARAAWRKSRPTRTRVRPGTRKTRVLERESAASGEATPGIPPSHCYRSGKLDWCDSLGPLRFSPTSPLFLHRLKELMSRFLLNTQPTPSSGHPAESGDHTPTHVHEALRLLAPLLSLCNQTPAQNRSCEQR